MKNTSIKQKILLIILGVFLAVVFLEIGLRIAGGVVFYLQERHNHVSLDHDEYRILCLGESTTALGGEDSYPSQLEQMLNAQNKPIKFKVINKGIIGTNTEYILSHVEQNLDVYKPQMVILMMGINDRYYLNNHDKPSWWENFENYLKDFRVYKLVHLIYEHTTHRIHEAKSTKETIDLSNNDDGDYQKLEAFLKVVIANSISRYSEAMTAAVRLGQKGLMDQASQEIQAAQKSADFAALGCIELARRYRLKELYQDAQDFLNEANRLNPKSPLLYQEWGELYLAQAKSVQAVNAFQAALSLDTKNSDVLLGLARALHLEDNDKAFVVYAAYLQSNPQDYWGYIELAQWLRAKKHDELAQGYLSRAIEVAGYIDQAYVDMGQVLDDQQQFEKEEKFFLKEISLHPNIPRLYQALGQFYQRQGREDLAREYLQKSVLPEVSEYYPATLLNYSQLLDKILHRHIKVLVMQYPLRDISFLKNYLGQKSGLIFVENRKNFRQALARQGYKYYFKDNFGNDFGHCTRAGNTLIAQNLSEVILKNVLGFKE